VQFYHKLLRVGGKIGRVNLDDNDINDGKIRIFESLGINKVLAGSKWVGFSDVRLNGYLFNKALRILEYEIREHLNDNMEVYHSDVDNGSFIGSQMELEFGECFMFDYGMRNEKEQRTQRDFVNRVVRGGSDNYDDAEELFQEALEFDW